jgi:probable phosphoglycerate mutase
MSTVEENYMLYIMRHGQTDWNAKHKLQGKTDIPLNDTGRAMALNAHNQYANVHIDVCYCSPLIRARQTAEIVLEGRNIPIITDERLSEMSFGIYEGTKNYFTDTSNPINVLFTQPEKYLTPIEGGESFTQLYSRTGKFLNEVIKPQLAQGKDILIVGHGAMNLSIINQINNIPLKDFWSAGVDSCKMLPLPFNTPTDITNLTDNEFNEELNKGYTQAISGKTKSAQSVFDNITKDYKL